MYRMLVVDDEVYAVRGVTQSIDWQELSITDIHEAYGAEQAKQLLLAQPIDIVIADIEMPRMNGLQLLEWINEHSPSTVTLFLTGHASFSYAKEAIRLGGFDYLLKPIDHDKLKEIVSRALSEIVETRKNGEIRDLYHQYLGMWEKRLPSLNDHFWQDVLERKKQFKQEQWEQAFQELRIPFLPSDRIVAVLVSVEEWTREFSGRDEEIMMYAVRCAAQDLFLEQAQGLIWQDSNDSIWVLLVHEEGRAAAIQSRAEQLIAACRQYFYCSASCYIGHSKPASQLSDAYDQLLQLERSNIHSPESVQLLGEPRSDLSVTALPWIPNWLTLLEMAKKEELLQKVDETIRELQSTNRTSYETVYALYHGISYLLYYGAHKQGLMFERLSSSAELQQSIPRSFAELKEWTKRVFEAYFTMMGDQENDSSAMIKKIKQYIADHLHEELTREAIASHVYLNTAYLSRLFKLETGGVLFDYITQTRMERAQELLRSSPMSVSSIAESVGYSHFSHFAGMFKKMYGVTPKDYRKRYQE
ncbi:response regulator [Paenibacillus sp. GCM10023252]|uniref:response regulator n=1 Tax=Paenibacillus sp. GCM10023252 TaxID=3252649 RepID=UPI003619D145